MASTDTKNPITITIITTAQTKLFASYQVMSATLSEYTSCFFWLCVFFLLQTQGNSVGDSFCFSHWVSYCAAICTSINIVSTLSCIRYNWWCVRDSLNHLVSNHFTHIKQIMTFCCCIFSFEIEMSGNQSSQDRFFFAAPHRQTIRRDWKTYCHEIFQHKCLPWRCFKKLTRKAYNLLTNANIQTPIALKWLAYIISSTTCIWTIYFSAI